MHRAPLLSRPLIVTVLTIAFFIAAHAPSSASVSSLGERGQLIPGRGR